MALLALGSWGDLHAQALSDAANPAAATPPTKTSPMQRPGPTWSELTEAEREGLSPLANIWPRLSEGQKLKWRAVVASAEFEDPASRAKLQERMKSWSQLSASERAQARLNFAMIHDVPSDERIRKWEAYRELPEEERQRLMQRHMRQVWGAATPMTPTSKDRLPALPPPPSPERISKWGWPYLKVESIGKRSTRCTPIGEIERLFCLQ